MTNVLQERDVAEFTKLLRYLAQFALDDEPKAQDHYSLPSRIGVASVVLEGSRPPRVEVIRQAHGSVA